MMNSKFSRRSFVKRCLSFSCIGMFGPQLALAAIPNRDLQLASGLLDTIDDMQEAIALGKVYLGEFGTHPTWQFFYARIANGITNDLISSSPKDFHKFMTSHIHRDYVNQDVVLINGWVFSQTEADLTAMAALLRK